MESLKKLKTLNFLIIIATFTFYINNYFLSWLWPSLDMITFFPKYYQDTEFGSDFMTSCYEVYTGRYFFGILTGLVYPLFKDWFSFLFFYRILIFIFLPISWYLALKALFKKNDLNFSIVLILLYTGLIAHGLNSFSSIFAFATWSPFSFHFHPGTVAAILTLFGIYFAFREFPFKFTSYIFIILGAFAHPIFSLIITFIFSYSKYFINSEDRNYFSLFLLNFSVSAFSSALGNFGNLELNSYLEYFAKFHPHHYLPSLEPGIVEDVIKIGILFIILVFIPVGNNSKNFYILTFSFFSLFVLTLITQYIFVELYPVSKFFILLSPSRFTSYIYWMFVICILFKFINYFKKLEKFFDRIVGSKSLILFFILNILFLYTQVNSIVDEKSFEKYSYLNTNEIEIIEWAKTNSLNNDLFLVLGSDNLNRMFTIESERGQYISIGYPFNDDCIEENYLRKKEFYDKPLSEIIASLSNYNFTYFNYLITATEVDSKNLEVVYSNQEYKIIKIFD
jgi:hypothetical protein